VSAVRATGPSAASCSARCAGCNCADRQRPPSEVGGPAAHPGINTCVPVPCAGSSPAGETPRPGWPQAAGRAAAAAPHRPTAASPRRDRAHTPCRPAPTHPAPPSSGLPTRRKKQLQCASYRLHARKAPIRTSSGWAASSRSVIRRSSVWAVSACTTMCVKALRRADAHTQRERERRTRGQVRHPVGGHGQSAAR
jgi:hypothetical protein